MLAPLDLSTAIGGLLPSRSTPKDDDANASIRLKAPNAPAPIPKKRRLTELTRKAVSGTLAGLDFGCEAIKANLYGLVRGLRPFKGKRLTSEMPILRPLGRTTATTGELMKATASLAKSGVTFDAEGAGTAADAALEKFLRLFALDALVNGPWADPGDYHGAITGGAPVPRKWGRLIGQSKNWTTRRPPEDMADDWKRGMKRWHATTNAIVAANANVAELIAAYLAGVGHEIDPASFESELAAQGHGVWSDSMLDLVANFAGLMVGLCVGNDDPEVLSRLVNRFAALIPGPPDPFESEKMDLDSARRVKKRFELATISLFVDSDHLSTDEKTQALRDSLPADENHIFDKVLVLLWNLEVPVEEGQPPRRLSKEERDGLVQHILQISNDNPAWEALLGKAQAHMDEEIRAGRDPWHPEDAHLPAPTTRANLHKAVRELDEVIRTRLKPLEEGSSLRKQLRASSPATSSPGPS